jgi:hypothetical protein
MHSVEEGLSGRVVKWNSASPGAPRALSIETIEALADDDLLSETRRIVCQSNRALAALLAYLGEVEARGLHRTRACSSLYAYCIYELRMSEDAAYRRVAAARLVKRFPVLFGAVERGELQLTGLLLLGAHLTETNVTEVLARAKFRTKKEILKLVRLLSPLPDVPSRIEPLGLERPRMRATWGNLLAARHPVRELPPDQRPASWLAASESLEFGAADPLRTPPLTPPDEDFTPACLERTPFPPVDTSARGGSKPSRADAPPSTATAPAPVGAESSPVDTPSRTVTAPARVGTESSGFDPASPTITAPARADETRVTLSGPQRYSVQFTASEEYVALVEEARALLAHALPSADIAEVHLRAMQTLVAALKKRKFAVSAREPVQAGASVRSAASVQSTASVRSAEPVGSAEAAPSFPADPTEPPRAVGCNAAHKAERAASANEHSARLPRQRGRYVPAVVRRAVFERDGHRCAFVDERGERCRETARLELHHHEPFARGGPPTAENLSLHCATHNALAAEGDFGRDFVLERREGGTHFSELSVRREALLDR